MKQSLVAKYKRCWVCGTTQGLHKHHIFEGNAERKKSEEYGCWCWLCGKHHNLSNEGVHFNKMLELELKKMCQKEFIKKYGEEKFMEVFGRNYT